jgi:hypothetical protein
MTFHYKCVFDLLLKTRGQIKVNDLISVSARRAFFRDPGYEGIHLTASSHANSVTNRRVFRFHSADAAVGSQGGQDQVTMKS